MEKEPVTVSIIIPAYNQAHYLGAAIASALGQSYGDVEVIVVDDGSTDNTREVVEQIGDPRLRYVYQENQGLSAARNTGIRHARGAYLSYLDSDDLFLPEKVALLLRSWRSDPSGAWSRGRPSLLTEPAARLAPCSTGSCRMTRGAAPAQPVARRQCAGPALVAGKAGFFDETCALTNWDMWLRLARSAARWPRWPGQFRSTAFTQRR